MCVYICTHTHIYALYCCSTVLGKKYLEWDTEEVMKHALKKNSLKLAHGLIHLD